MNKYQEALNLLIEEHRQDRDWTNESLSATEYLQELVDKATPKKPHLEGDGYWNGELVYDTWICPNCDKDYEVDYDKYDYCPNCGQHIDWSEYE